MLSELSAVWGPQLLAFMEELPRETNNFPKYALQLIAKHFGFTQLLIFPYAYSAIDLEKRSKRDALSNFLTVNIESRLVKEYADKVSKFDIFNPKHLPTNLRNQKVLFTNDVMSREKYLKTEYFAYMAEQDMERQACIYLRYKNEIIGNICVFRSKNDPEFTGQDRALMEYLSEVISNQYVLSLRLTGDVLSQEGFNLFFRNSKVGAVMLNSRLTVLMANATAQEHSKSFLNFYGKENSFAARSSYQRTSKYDSIQQAMDWIGLDLINNESGTTSFSSLQEELHFYYWPLIFINVFSDVETRHLILSTNQKKQISAEFQDFFFTLTQRESEILKFVLAGNKNEKIAEALHVSIFTVRTHISNIYRKFEVNSRAELLIKVNRAMEFEEKS